MKKLLILSITLLSSAACYSQILISLIFGETLNSDKVEFGLDGGYTLVDIQGLNNSNPRSSLHLGSYFDITVYDNLDIHTGVLLKSPGGTKEFPLYQTGDPAVDLLIQNSSERVRRLSYIHLYLQARYYYWKGSFVDLGFQGGFMTRGIDVFSTTGTGPNQSLEFERRISDSYSRWDAGLAVSLGYKFKSWGRFSVGAKYYYGFVDIDLNPSNEQFNRILYIFSNIPIGLN